MFWLYGTYEQKYEERSEILDKKLAAENQVFT